MKVNANSYDKYFFSSKQKYHITNVDKKILNKICQNETIEKRKIFFIYGLSMLLAAINSYFLQLFLKRKNKNQKIKNIT